MSEALPFEQQPEESAQAFAAFVVYRDMRADRSLEAVGQKLGKSTALMTRWSKRHHWVGRARSYDVALDARARVVTEKEAIQQRRAMLREHADEARALRRFAKQVLDEIHRRYVAKDGTLHWVTGDDLIKLVAQLPKIVDTAQRLERLAVGEPAENLEPPKPPEEMTTDELDAYIRLLQESLT